MTRTRRIYLATLLAALSASQAAAQSGPLDARAVRPAVMLLVDTSGSMERIPDDGTNPNCDDCVPTCTGNTTADSANKTRWAMTVEALTGTIQNYTCRSEDRSRYASDQYDYGYYLPHINFTENLTQASDGILDSFANRVKFGLMTFDGVGTTLNGETLVPMSDWAEGTPFYDRAYGGPGMYSYAKPGALSFPGCPTTYGINAGARGPGDHPGALIRVGASDNIDDILNVNNKIQQSLLTVRPFGGTPIAAMLDDLRYYVEGGTVEAVGDKDSDLSRTADPLYSCRKRVAILITDGAPDKLFRDTRFQCYYGEKDPSVDQSICGGGKCACPYKPAEEVARSLIDAPNHLLEQLIVVAYNVHDHDALVTLNAIGQAGSTAPVTGSTTEFPYLVQADGPTELRDRLDDLLNASQPGVTSRSVPISVNTGDDVLGANAKRFDITAGFQVGRNADAPWSGLLFRRRVFCGGTNNTDVIDDTDYDVGAGDVFHESLNRRGATSRRLITVAPSLIGSANGSLINGRYAPERVLGTDSSFDTTRMAEVVDGTGHRVTTSVQNHKKPNGDTFSLLESLDPDLTFTLSQGVVTDAINPEVNFDNNLNSLYFGDANSNGLPGEAADRQLIVDYVRGASRPGNMLADIYHSNPVALIPLNRFSTTRFGSINEAYGNWLRALVRTTDGPHYGDDGRPGVVFVGTNDGVLHAFNLDDWHDGGGGLHRGGEELWGFIPPALFGKMASMLGGHQFMFDGTPMVQDVVLQKRGTEMPIFRTVLVSAVRGAPSFIALDVTYPEAPVFLWQASFPNVGNTVANPALTQVDVQWRSEKQTRAVAILPGGEGSQSASACTGGRSLVDDVTRAKFPAGNTRNVRCWNNRGRSLYVVDVATGQLIQEFGPEHFPSPLTGSVVVDGNGINRSTAAYFFDHDGILWRLSMLHADPSEWRVQPLYDMFSSPEVGPLPDWQAGRRPTFPPTLTLDSHGSIVVLAGTGDVDSPMDSARQRVVSLTEYRNADDSDSEIAGTVALNWQVDLLPNEGVTGPLTVFNDNVYFGTFESLAGANQCALGKSRIYGLHAFMSNGSNAVPPVPKPELVATNARPTDPRVASEIFDPSGSNLLIGLTVKRQPLCQTTARITNPITGQSMPATPPGGGMYQLSGVLAGSSTGGDLRGGGAQISELPPQTLQSDTQHTTISSWATYAD